jgi:hypothetical protein
VEFALILPLLLVLLLGVADFGRVFAAGIVVQAASRNAAEAVAQEYVQYLRGGVATVDYGALHARGLAVACSEASSLPNRAVDGSGNCTMPVVGLCIHDNLDTQCQGQAGGPAQCGDMNGPWSNQDGGTDMDPAVRTYVEVRLCYQFTTLFNLQNLDLPFGASVTLGDAWLQRTAAFVVPNY